MYFETGSYITLVRANYGPGRTVVFFFCPWLANEGIRDYIGTDARQVVCMFVKANIFSSVVHN